MEWSPLADKIHQFLTRNSLLKKKDKLLLAVSGGMDSVVMFYVFLELLPAWDWELVLGHIDHGLRPGQDEKEARFCRSLAKDHQLPYRGIKLDLNDPGIKDIYAQYSTQAPSLESLARFGRYEILSDWADELQCDAVCLAHHAGDQAETILYRMLTGAGIKGLGGIPSSRNAFKRPFIKVLKEEIEEYAKNKKLQYFNDTSNLDISYMRNNIRHRVLPLLTELGFDHCDKALSKSALSLQEADEALDYYLGIELDSLLAINRESTELDIDRFLDCPIFMQKRILKEIYREKLNIKHHISDDQSEQMLSFIQRADPGTRFELYGITMLKGRAGISWMPNEPQNIQETIVCREGTLDFDFASLDIRKESAENNRRVGNMNKAVFSSELLGKPLTLRSWEKGDKIRVFGQGYQKKISDVLKDEKIKPGEKNKYPVLEYNNDIIWIPGVKRSNLFVVAQNDQELLKFTYKTEKSNDQKNPDT